MEQRICDAIKARNVICFQYKGGIRTVEPYCYGISTANNEILRGYQIGGHSGSGESLDWKRFTVNKISNLIITKGIFDGKRPKYNPNDKAMVTIFCNV